MILKLRLTRPCLNIAKKALIQPRSNYFNWLKNHLFIGMIIFNDKIMH